MTTGPITGMGATGNPAKTGRSAAVAPSLLVILVGHLLAAFVFWFTFNDKNLRAIWLAQFYILLGISLLIFLYTFRTRKQHFRIVALLNVAAVHVVAGYPEGANLAIAAILGSMFVICAMLAVRGAVAYVLSFGYTAVVAGTRLPVSAWYFKIGAPSVADTILFAVSMIFLAWFAGLIGTRERKITVQREEIDRLDRTVEALSKANLDLQEWGTTLQRETEIRERRRIAREIHDIVGYTLTNIQMMMEAGTDLVRTELARTNPSRLTQLLLNARDQAQRGLLETRRAMRDLRTVLAVRVGGMRRLREIVRIFANATGISVELHPGNTPGTLDHSVDDVVYRMVQECLTNSFRHGKATAVTISLWVIDGILRATITDNGVGAAQIVPDVGLAGMTERVERLNGTLRAEGTPFGFRVYAEIPLLSEEEREKVSSATG